MARGWTAFQISNGGEGHWDGVRARQDPMPRVCRSLQPQVTDGRGLGSPTTWSLGEPWVQAGAARIPSGR